MNNFAQKHFLSYYPTIHVRLQFACLLFGDNEHDIIVIIFADLSVWKLQTENFICSLIWLFFYNLCFLITYFTFHSHRSFWYRRKNQFCFQEISRLLNSQINGLANCLPQQRINHLQNYSNATGMSSGSSHSKLLWDLQNDFLKNTSAPDSPNLRCVQRRNNVQVPFGHQLHNYTSENYLKTHRTLLDTRFSIPPSTSWGYIGGGYEIVSQWSFNCSWGSPNKKDTRTFIQNGVAVKMTKRFMTRTVK